LLFDASGIGWRFFFFFFFYFVTNFAFFFFCKEQIKLCTNSSLNLAVQRRKCRSKRPRVLRRKSVAACLLRLWVRTPPGAWLLVMIVVCCQVEFSATSWSLVQRSPTECGASFCMIYKPPEWGSPGPLGAFAPKRKKCIYTSSVISFLHILTFFDALGI
jgi:hypothetical protein